MIIEITYEAKCKHCKFFESGRVGKRKYHYCNNPAGKWYKATVTLKDRACNNIEL